MSTIQPAVERDEVRAAVRFPLHLSVTIQWETESVDAVTEDVSSNGMLFHAERLPPVNAGVSFTLKMPAAIMGSPEDVVLQCVGRIVRHHETAGKHMAAAVIDEYSLKAEHQ